ncbi:MAG: hypothetical protein LBE49_06135, partial [Deltaproteobacteria bacterium]|nr:hypothetical protein [Deltaproteobacteria bacterium]
MSRSGPSPSSDLDPPKSAGHPSAARIASPGSNESSSTLISRKLPLFSILILVAVTALAMAAYSFSARKTNEAYVERQLMFASETLRMLLYS